MARGNFSTSPFRRRQAARRAAAAEYPGEKLYEVKQTDDLKRDPREQVLIADCPQCGHSYRFSGKKMNRGGMFQVKRGDDECPSCGTPAGDVHAMSPEKYYSPHADDPNELPTPEPPVGMGPIRSETLPSGEGYRKAKERHDEQYS